MDALFGFSQTAKFKEALEKTAQKFDNMSAEEVFELARQHADGDIAQFVKQTQDTQ